jgi:A/G-specific adenine glycosylase
MSVTGALLTWYERFGRRHLPWRQTRDPYAIVVAEFMLQQTQVERALPSYTAFLERFPTFAALAASDAGDVIRAWRGLGYNSRARRLQLLARAVIDEFGGRVPRERELLRRLPGVGPYTAAAVRAFAFDLDDVALDTNIRRVVGRVMFGLEVPTPVDERAVDAAAGSMIPRGRGHDWNSAMMDLGATICTARAPKCLLCPLAPHCAAAPVDPARLVALTKAAARRSPQEALPFVRTTRFLRGRVIDRLRDLPPRAVLSLEELGRDLTTLVPPDRLAEIPLVVDALVAEQIVTRDPLGVRLSS